MTDRLSSWAAEISVHASKVDVLALGLAVLVLVLSAPVFVLIVVFAVRYRRGKPADRAHAVNRNVWLETSWAVIPFLLMLIFFAQATWLYAELYHPPANALEIAVVARQWMWKFQHPTGQREIDELHVPANQPVRWEDVVFDAADPAVLARREMEAAFAEPLG